MNKTEIRKFTDDILKCSNFEGVREVLRDSRLWTRNVIGLGLIETIFMMADSTDVYSVIQNLSSMITANGFELEGGDLGEREEDIIEHFQNNAMEFSPICVMYMIFLGFVPITYHYDTNTDEPVFQIAEYTDSEYHIFHNCATKARVLLRWDKHLCAYDPLTRFLVINRPKANGKLTSFATHFLKEFMLLEALREKAKAEVERLPQYFLQKRQKSKNNNEHDKLEEAFYGQAVRNGKMEKKKGAVWSERTKIGSGEADLVFVTQDYEVVNSTNVDVTRQYEGDSWVDRHNQAQKNFARRLYELLGIPADSTEESRRESGLGREAADRDKAISIQPWVKRVENAVQIGVDLSYPLLFVNDQKTHAEIMHEKHVERAKSMNAYLDRTMVTGEKLPPDEDVLKHFQIKEPTIVDFERAVKRRLPKVTISRDRRFTDAQIALIRDSSAFSESTKRKLEADALGVEADEEGIEEQETEERSPKKQKPLSPEPEE